MAGLLSRSLVLTPCEIFILLFILFTVTEEHPTESQELVLPARIYGSSASFKVGEYFEARCSIFGLKRDDEKVFVYLCKNGVGIAVLESKNMDASFTVGNITKEHSGNYSCMFSRTKHHPCAVRGHGENFISIRVTDIHPAIIAAKSMESGAEVDLSCSSSDASDTSLFLAYLCRNRTIIDVQMWNSQKKQASFHLRTLQGSDTGSYSCVLSEHPLAATELDTCGVNSVFLRVYGDSVFQLNGLTSVIAVDESRVRKGSDVHFRCSSTDAPDASVLHAYFCRSQTIIGMEMFDSQKKQASFHLRDVQEDDAGSYSCVVSDMLLAAKELGACGRHAVFLEVYGPEHISRWNENLIRILCSTGVVIIAVIILLNSRFCQQRLECPEYALGAPRV
ncbi:uncharacterized protein LOC134068557 [Sardina pilchardus]|uniref:uncharacterized protein LOC134068557 n=1 Tax=Sardina pilchardus TaxID=27697 RepID=UPI002E0E6295